MEKVSISAIPMPAGPADVAKVLPFRLPERSSGQAYNFKLPTLTIESPSVTEGFFIIGKSAIGIPIAIGREISLKSDLSFFPEPHEFRRW
jgi:hypothetical protein